MAKQTLQDAHLLFMKGGGDFRILELFVTKLSNGDDAEIACDEEDRENFPLDSDDLAPDLA